MRNTLLLRVAVSLSAILLAGSLGAAAVQNGQQAAPDPGAIGAQVEALMARFLVDASVVGVSVGVERGEQVLARGGWGFADREAKRPATAETTYRLGSVSKQFTAALVMRLVERGNLSLDDPVDRHWPNLPKKWRGIIVRQLLNHTSGVPDFTATGPEHWPKNLPPPEMLALVADDSPHFSPGTKYEYSNSNYMMLGLIAERYYSKPLPQILQDEIAKPLGLKTTRFCEDAYGANGQAQPYVRDGDRIEKAPYRSVAHSFGAGGVCSTVADVAIWNRALHNGKVVTGESYKLMTTPQGAATEERYGFGLMVRPIGARSALFHSGGVPGFIAINAWVPPEGVSVTIVTNTSPTSQTPFLYRDLTRLAFGQPVTIVQPSAGPQPDAAALRKYAGTYTIQIPGRPLDVRFWVDGNTLMSQATGQNQAPLRYSAEHSFGARADWTVRFTFVMENGMATGLKFEQGGQQFTGTRKN